MRYYLDTNIWMDIIERRPGWKAATQLILRIIEQEGYIIISNILIHELLKYYTVAEVTSALRIIPQTPVTLTSEQRAFAQKLVQERHVSFGDASHAVLSRDHGCVLVTRDRDFSALSDIAKPYTPEELL